MKGCVLPIVLAVLIGLLCFAGVKYYYVFGEGVKAGTLNRIVYKGYVFKTYEGLLIQEGIRSGKAGGSSAGGGIQSNEFEFSVERKSVADSLMRCSGKTVEVHYREYMSALPWRGMSVYVVDSIMSVGPSPTTRTAE